jgi:hypothetical protein
MVWTATQPDIRTIGAILMTARSTSQNIHVLAVIGAGNSGRSNDLLAVPHDAVLEGGVTDRMILGRVF